MLCCGLRPDLGSNPQFQTSFWVHLLQQFHLFVLLHNIHCLTWIFGCTPKFLLYCSALSDFVDLVWSLNISWKIHMWWLLPHFLFVMPLSFWLLGNCVLLLMSLFATALGLLSPLPCLVVVQGLLPPPPLPFFCFSRVSSSGGNLVQGTATH